MITTDKKTERAPEPGGSSSLDTAEFPSSGHASRREALNPSPSEIQVRGPEAAQILDAAQAVRHESPSLDAVLRGLAHYRIEVRDVSSKG
jgi:hypothetical protein